MNRIFLVFAMLMAVLCVSLACNEAICGPRVSKCLLIKCCDCDMSDKSNCSCCRDCALCLTKLYTDCCSCVGLCPVPDPNDSMAKTSTVEDLPDPIPGLFNALTEEEDMLQRWTTFTYALDLDKLLFQDKSKPKSNMGMKVVKADDGYIVEEEPLPKEPVLGIKNCTVAFFSDCLSMSKCKLSCTSMGASKYRWFHEHGCCQCVGNSCFDYGLSQPHCLQCPEKSDMAYEEGSIYREWTDPSLEVSRMDAAIDSL